MSTPTTENLQQYFTEIAKYPLLTATEEVELATAARKGDSAARERMIQSNLRLVVKIANEIFSNGMSLSDRISEGNIGLMKAVDRFDPAVGTRFSTYACWWIRQAVQRGIANQGKTIRLPVHVSDKIIGLNKAMIQLADELGREATPEEIADRVKMPVRKVESLLESASMTIPIDSNSFEGGRTLGDTLTDENTLSPDMSSVQSCDSEQMAKALATLNDRERILVSARFGLDGDAPMTLEDVGDKLSMSRERVRQLQRTALDKLRFAFVRNEHGLGVEESEMAVA